MKTIAYDKHLDVAIIILLIGASIALAYRFPHLQLTLPSVEFVGEDNRTITVPVEVAGTPYSRMHGLADRETLPKNHGMLFVWEETAASGGAFTMAGMRFSLDILFIQAAPDEHIGIISYIAESLFPCPDRNACTIVSPPQPYRYVVEVNGGFTKQYAIHVGDKVRIVR